MGGDTVPGNYAHYRLGAQLLPGMRPEVQRIVKRHRRLYDAGLYGPDIFFYHNIFRADNVVQAASHFHNLSGRTLFTRIAKHLRLAPSEPALAYLYGLLVHYCLDSHCHPLIQAISSGDQIGHVQLETEFDRYLLVLDGKTPPSTHFSCGELQLAWEECQVVADVYGNVTPEQVRTSIRTMANVARLLTVPKGGFRSTVKKALVPQFAQYLMFDTPDPQCAHLNETLMALYEATAMDFPELERQITAYLTCGVPLGSEFAPIFG